MLTYALKDLATAARAIGRATVMYAATRWDGTTNLTLEHLGDTKGDIGTNFNESLVHLTTAETTGNAKHKSYVEGEDPVVTIPLYTADPELRPILSPTGNASGGYSRRQPVMERTLVLFPEELLYDKEARAYKDLTFDGTAWKVNGKALTPEQERLMGLSIWLWRGYFSKPGLTYKHGDAGESVDQVTFQVMMSDLPTEIIPEGERLYTIGDPAAKLIDIHPAS